jgi:hypothetical protein
MQFGNRAIVSCAVVVLALASLGATSVASANILVNGDFETGDLTGWQVFGASPSSSVTIQSPDNGPSAPGTHNAFMDNQAEALGLILKQSTDPGTATAGDVDYSFDLKLIQADVGGVFFVEMFAEQSGVGIVGGSGLLGPFWPWGAWETFTGSFAAPAGTDFLTIQFAATTGAATGSTCLMHVDNVVLDQGTSPVESTTWSSVKALFR